MQNTSYILARYNYRNSRFYVIGRGSVENGRNTLNKSVRERTAGQDTRVAGGLTESRHSLEVDREYQRAGEEQKAKIIDSEFYVYIGRIDPNVEDDVASQCHEIARSLNELEDTGYDNRKHVRAILSDSIKNTSCVLTRYNPKTHRFYVIGRGSVESGTNTLYKSNRGRASGEDTRITGDRTDRRRSRDIDDSGRTSLLQDDKRLDEINITLRQVFDSQELETGHHTSQTQVQRVA